MFDQKIILPKIRNDLKVIETSVAEDGSKRWLLFDPIQNKYFNIGLDALQLFSNWQSDIEIDEFIKILEQKDYDIDKESLESFVVFLRNNNLYRSRFRLDFS